MKILVFGSNGQIGHEICKELQTFGKIFKATRTDKTSDFHVDFSKPNTVENCILTLHPQIIINAAAYTNVDGAENEFEKAMGINGKTPIIIAKLAHKIDATLIHFSTDYVFDVCHSDYIDEKTLANPPNKYGESKLFADEGIKKTEANAIILRTSWVYSTHGHNFVKTMIKLAQDNERIQVVNDQIGCPTSSRTLAKAVARILEKTNEMGKNWLMEHKGLYHLSDYGEISWFDFAEEIFKLAREYGYKLKLNELVAIKSTELQTKARRPKNSRLNNRKFLNTFNFYPPAWQDVLRKDFFDES